MSVANRPVAVVASIAPALALAVSISRAPVHAPPPSASAPPFDASDCIYRMYRLAGDTLPAALDSITNTITLASVASVFPPEAAPEVRTFVVSRSVLDAVQPENGPYPVNTEYQALFMVLANKHTLAVVNADGYDIATRLGFEGVGTPWERRRPFYGSDIDATQVHLAGTAVRYSNALGWMEASSESGPGETFVPSPGSAIGASTNPAPPYDGFLRDIVSQMLDHSDRLGDGGLSCGDLTGLPGFGESVLMALPLKARTQWAYNQLGV